MDLMHLKDKHNKQSILQEDVEHLKALWVEFKIVRNLKNVPRPPNGGPPLPGIKILSGIACRHCPHIAQEVSSMVTHWYGYHTEDRTAYVDEYVWCPVCLQVLSGSALRYFEVVLPPAAAAPPGDLLDMDNDQHGSKFPFHAIVNLAPILNEVPPLQKDTAVMDSPIRDETRHWRPLDDDSTLKKYAASLYHFLLEYLIALQALQEQGQFIEPSLATRLFAKVKYQIRRTILHQGIRTMSEHENNPLESVKAVAKQTIYIGTDTPFISIQYYQNDDGMNISYKGSTLSITHWRQGFSHALEQTEARLEALLCGLKVNLKMLKNYGDDWSDAQTPGYSWTKHSDLGKFKTILLQHYIRDIAALTHHICMLAYFPPGGNNHLAEHQDHKLINGTQPRIVFRHIWLAIHRNKTENRVVQLIIRPFEARLVHHLYGEEASLITKQFLWVQMGQRVTARTIGLWVKDFMKEYCCLEAGAREYRQLYVEICRVFVGSALDSFLDGEDVGDDDVGILQ
ncbi:hypothetical protein M422DRAFT_273009 [Sphaerobolus stellatus SS14]|uniref:Unplaced genomic scaffold SPHSTscaffold_315, whole genome shotgun sequence n=1 Tax=Sphaerobolus stellatus (strain SS14) TaxID=990650 RepID=A0A0C9UL74_SPHS4|nr:hypothetical protein M422DRAFT_273009 [Sphaerobolus stellatus SS14]